MGKQKWQNNSQRYHLLFLGCYICSKGRFGKGLLLMHQTLEQDKNSSNIIDFRKTPSYAH
jgi:hypothetical protein